MNVSVDQGELEKEKAEQIVADTPLMDGIDKITVELDDYDTGDPALLLLFLMSRDVRPDNNWYDRFNEFAHQLGMRIIHSGITRFPYKRLRPAA